MSDETNLTANHGQHAQNVLASAMKTIAIDWDKDARKRDQLIKELRALDQKMAAYEQVRRELSSAAAILDHLAYAVPGTDKTPAVPDTPEEFDRHQRPTSALARYTIRMEPVEGVNR